MTTKQRFESVLDWFAVNMPIAESELHYANPYQLLVAVILSAQCTDKRVNMTLVAVYGGQVPDNIDDLQTLPGVGRKTANVVCAVIWNQPTMAVDTHIFRVSERIGLTTNSKNPLQTEKQLVKYIPQDLIPKAHHWLLLHGRYICQARKPKCESCGLQPYCRYNKTSAAS